MGADRPSSGDQSRGAKPLGVIAEVIVDLDVWGLDRPLSYRVPEKLRERAEVGRIVRVPIRGRRVRGWIVRLEEGAPGDLAEVASVGGRAPVFDLPLLEAARRLSRRFVHPLSQFLRLMTPENAGRFHASPAQRAIVAEAEHRLVRLAPAEDPVPLYEEAIDRALRLGLGAIVAVPEIKEGSSVLGRIESKFGGESVRVDSTLTAAERSDNLWALALGEKKVALGGRGAVLAPAFPCGIIIVHEEGHRSHKAERSPYFDARTVAFERASAAGTGLLLTARAPSIAAMSRVGADWNMIEPERDKDRLGWPRLEFVEPSRSPVPRRAVAAVIETFRKGDRTLVYVPRTKATRAGPGPDLVMSYLRRVVPEARVTRADRPWLEATGGSLAGALEGDVVVAGETLLGEVDRPRVKAAAVLGADSLLARHGVRTSEDAFSTLWRLACLLAGGDGAGRLVVETSTPEHHTFQALARCDYHYFLTRELGFRERDALPPFRSLVRIRVTAGPDDAGVWRELADLPGVELMGPVDGRMGREAIVKVKNLEEALDPLRGIIAGSKARILVEVDPRDI